MHMVIIKFHIQSKYEILYNMSGWEIELNDLDEARKYEQEEQGEEEETDFGGEDNLDGVSNRI